MAHYDPHKKEIVGCKEGTLTWYHEDRHRQQMEITILYNLWLWLPTIASIIGMWAITMAILWRDPRVFIFPGLAIIPQSLLLFYLEIDAWVYAFWKKWR